jgi:ABC-type bacteriocin/lantibiotic exporter with double-glycine peptidase domain
MIMFHWWGTLIACVITSLLTACITFIITDNRNEKLFRERERQAESTKSFYDFIQQVKGGHNE